MFLIINIRAFHEYHLAHRMISYTSNEIKWRCRDMNTCEPGCVESPLGIGSIGHVRGLKGCLNYPLTQEIKGLNRASIFKLWHSVLARYTRTQMAFSGNKLVALSGLASLFGKHLD